MYYGSKDSGLSSSELFTKKQNIIRVHENNENIIQDLLTPSDIFYDYDKKCESFSQAIKTELQHTDKLHQSEEEKTPQAYIDDNLGFIESEEDQGDDSIFFLELSSNSGSEVSSTSCKSLSSSPKNSMNLPPDHSYHHSASNKQREALTALLEAVKNQKRQHYALCHQPNGQQYHQQNRPFNAVNYLNSHGPGPNTEGHHFWSDSELANFGDTLNYSRQPIQNHLRTNNKQTLSQPAIVGDTVNNYSYITPSGLGESDVGITRKPGNENIPNVMALAAFAAAKAMAAMQNSTNPEYFSDLDYYSNPEFYQKIPPILLRNRKAGPSVGYSQPSNARLSYGSGLNMIPPNNGPAQIPFHQILQQRGGFPQTRPMMINRIPGNTLDRSYDDYINYESLAALQNPRLGPYNNYSSLVQNPNQANYQNINAFNNRLSPSFHDFGHLNDFRLLVSERNHPIHQMPNDLHPMYPFCYGITGQIVLQLISGTGLASDNGLLKDLYCVIESDSERKSRTMIRTSCDTFEWNECFEIDIENGQYLAILLYQWDPRTRHRLCFYGGINVTSLIKQNFIDKRMNEACDERSWLSQLSPHVRRANPFFEKIVLQLEPKGSLYLRIAFLPMEKVYARISNHSYLFPNQKSFSNSTSVLFGIRIKELFDREIRINRVMRPLQVNQPSLSLHRYVPLIIRKCIIEVDRRGVEVVGIYRLSGSILMKLHLRELFENATASIQSGLINEDYNSIANVVSLIDLSPEKVPDIHAITAILKDFLRELPEPLFTNALYPMIHDAMQISMPANSQNGAKLMLNILDCLPTPNQEILLYLLDHLKKVIRNCKINKMTSHHLAACLAPVLLYPSPDVAGDLDPVILEPARMTAILKYILDIWPDSRSADNSSVDSTKPEIIMPDRIVQSFESDQLKQSGPDPSLNAGSHHRYQQKKHAMYFKSGEVKANENLDYLDQRGNPRKTHHRHGYKHKSLPTSGTIDNSRHQLINPSENSPKTPHNPSNNNNRHSNRIPPPISKEP